MNNFLKYPQGGGGSIDTTSMLSKDNLVSIGGAHQTIGPDGGFLLTTKDLLNHDNDFNNIENKDTDTPDIFEIKFKDISFLINYDEFIVVNRNIQMHCEPSNVNNCAEIKIDNIDMANPTEKTNIITGKYYFTINASPVEPGIIS